MSRFYYDFHMHSCLSPCADNDNTPNNLAGMAALAGLEIVALTDHNTARNCPAFFEAAERYGLIPVSGMELTTSEDIHVVCLFEELGGALAFDREIAARHRLRVKNRADVYGEQYIMDGQDNVIGIEPDFLPVATDISVDSAPALAAQYGGICYPAHIDRQANGIVSVLGTFPEHPAFPAAEFHDPKLYEAYLVKYPALSGRRLLYGSDAHDLLGIRDKQYFLELPEARGDAETVRKSLFDVLKGALL